MYQKILIRFGELSTKGKNKINFINKLSSNINSILNIKTQITYDRIFINYSEDNLEKLQKIFGIQSYSPIYVCKTNEKIILESVIKIFNYEKINASWQTFGVVVKKHWKFFQHASMDFASLVGREVQNNFINMKVNLKSPDIQIGVEIHEDNTYIYLKTIKGLGGYPVGINGKVIHLISGGIDSPVAAYQMMKRGIHVDFLNFITPPHTDLKMIEKINKIIIFLNTFQTKSILYRNNFTDLMNLIGLISNQSYKIILMRRSFYRIASKLASEYNYSGISNGENLGQVASQTLESMSVIEEQSNKIILRPLLTNDKLETIAFAEKIGTLNFSNEKANESCEIFAPNNPVIKPLLKIAYLLEKELLELEEMEEKNYLNNFEKIIF